MDGAEQRLGHLMLRIAEHLPHLAVLDDPAVLQHHNAMADLADHLHLVGDQHDGEAEAAIDVAAAAQGLPACSRGRARRSPRRTTAPPADAPARGRCRRAASGRRTAGRDRRPACRRGRPCRAARRLRRSISRRSTPATLSGSATFCHTVFADSRLKCWKIMPTRRRSAISLRVVEGADVLVVDQHAAGGGLLQAVQGADQRRLAGAAAADHAEHLAAADREVDVDQAGSRCAGIVLRQALDHDVRTFQSAATAMPPAVTASITPFPKAGRKDRRIGCRARRALRARSGRS